MPCSIEPPYPISLLLPYSIVSHSFIDYTLRIYKKPIHMDKKHDLDSFISFSLHLDRY